MNSTLMQFYFDFNNYIQSIINDQTYKWINNLTHITLCITSK